MDREDLKTWGVPIVSTLVCIIGGLLLGLQLGYYGAILGILIGLVLGIAISAAYLDAFRMIAIPFVILVVCIIFGWLLGSQFTPRWAAVGTLTGFLIGAAFSGAYLTYEVWLPLLMQAGDRVILYILSALALAGLLISAWSHVLSGDTNWAAWADGAFQNFGTEVIGAILTFILLEGVVSTRKNRDALFAQIRAGNVEILRTLSAYRVYVSQGDLSYARLEGQDLSGINLSKAKLQNAKLQRANLAGVTLRETDFRGADLTDANLRGATMILRPIHDENTTLPDGTKAGGARLVDWRRYTNPDHKNFWEPDWVKEQSDS